ncbi:MAG: PstS family phosphate ABC transporter substrate-binding protein [Rhodospirillales bacterium]|nr:PstS family phosphate ABC transporter substrate-binding protein [Rhodospirillales bacterium]QQS14824.1 MAG: PstS family phosphate ABC transporter substrate-binding protein [Rhodospirillales bacterium]
MLLTRLVSIAALATAGSGAAFAQTTIKIDGSSTVFPITEAVAEEFQKSQKGKVRVTVGISGTGGGFKKFCRGEIDIADASRPILKSEMDDCGKAGITYVEVPVAFDALTVAVNPKNTWATTITMAELKKMWEPAAKGVVMKWKDVRADWPDTPLTLFGAGADSGTFDYFTEAVTGKAKSSRSDFTASEDDNVLVQGIENDRNALGFIPYAYYQPHATKMKALAIDEGKGKGGVLPSEKTVVDGTYSPMSRPLFLYINVKALGRPEMKAFLDFYLKSQKLITEVKYVPLPEQAYVIARERVAKATAGTAFGGHPEVGLPILDLLKREPKS